MRKDRIKAVFIKKPYIYITIVSFLVYLVINALVNDWHIFISGIFEIYWYIAYPYVIFSIVIAIMVAVSISLGYMRLKELQRMSGASGLSLVGAFFGVITGACPGCLVGILPAVVGLFGGTLSLSQLPLFGIEIQILTISILIFAIYYLTKENTCKVKAHTSN